MDIENKYEEILVKYILNEANESEITVVKEWLEGDADNILHFKALVNTLQLISAKEDIQNINTEQEWQHLQQLIKENSEISIAGDEDTGTVVEMFPDKNTGSRPKIYKVMIAVAAAAAIIIAVLWGTGKMSGNAVDSKEIARENINIDTSSIGKQSGITLHEVNTTGKMKMISLPDGSVVKLYENSEFTYKEQYPQKNREVFLTGKADFKVVKDNARPFMVYSGDIYTTDIGTEFRVTAMQNAHQILVRLFEGKVVVNSVKAKNGKVIKNAFLVPGQELVYDVNNGTASIQSFADGDSRANATADNVVVPNYKQTWFMFNNQRLSSIFKDLEKMYDVKIVYSKEEIGKIYFIGTFDKNDSIGFILKQIASVNNLKVNKENNTYTIKK